MASRAPDNRYEGFISYSHAADGELAPQLQSALHGFAKPWYRLRAIRMFRDKTSLSATPSLWPAIETALRNSGFLLLMASPDAAKSHWVIKEVETFLDFAGPKRILIVLTSGNLEWNEAAADFDWGRTDAFPQLGRPVFEAEPLWVDLRALRTSESVSLRNPDFRDAVARLSSALRGIPTDQLIGEDIRHHRRTMRLLWSALMLFAVLAAGLAFAGYYSYRKGIEAYNNGVAAQAAARRTRSEFMVSAATTLETDDPLTSALVLSELDDSYQSDRALALLRRVANELPVAVLEGIDPKFSADGSRFLTFPTHGNNILLWSVNALENPIVIKGHGGSVIDAAIDSQGRRVAIASDDHTVTVWDVDGHREVAVINGYAPVYSVMDRDSIVISGDGTRVAFLNGNRAEIASTAGQHPPVDLNGHSDAVLTIAYSPDGRHVATGSLDRTTRVWNADGSQAEVFRIGSSHPVHAQFSGDGSRVLTLDDNGTVRLWRMGAGGSATVFNPLDYTPNCATLRSDGRWLVAGTKEGSTLVWNVDAPQKPPSVLRGAAWVRHASFTPEGTHIVTASDDGRARVWSFDSDRPMEVKVHHGLLEYAIFEAAHHRIFTSGIGDTTQAWSPDGSEAEPTVLKGHQGHVVAIDFSPDGKRAVTASEDGTVRLWSTDGNTPPLILRGHTAEVWTVAFSRDGAHIVTVSKDGTARIRNADGHGESVVLRDEAGPVIAVAFSYDGARVVTTAGPARVWSIDGHPGGVVFGDTKDRARYPEFSPDGTRVLVVGRKSAFVCNADGRGSPVELRVDDSDGVVQARFSPDGKRVVGRSGKTAIVWQADGSGQPLVLPINARVRDARFSPDGKSVLVVGFAFGAYLYRADGRGAALFLEEPDGGWLSDAVFSADGKRVAASTSLHTVMVWRTDGPSAPLTLAGHTDLIQGIAMNPVAPMIGTASWDGTARLRSIDWRDLMKYVRTSATHSGMCLNSEQRIQYLGEEADQAQAQYQACKARSGRGD